MLNPILVVLAAVPALAGCTSTMHQVTQDLAGVNQILSGRGSGLVAISQPQSDKIDQQLTAVARSTTALPLSPNAFGTISAFTRAEGCVVASPGGTSLNRWAAPGASFAYYNSAAPTMMMRYHNKGSCASLVRFQNLTMPARNALRYEVVFISEQSGETATQAHELVQQPSGQWLYRH